MSTPRTRAARARRPTTLAALALAALALAAPASAELAPSPPSATPTDAPRTFTLEVPADLDPTSAASLLAAAGVHALSLPGHGPSRVGRFWQVRADVRARARLAMTLPGAAWWPAVPEGMRPLDAAAGEPAPPRSGWDLAPDAPHLATRLSAAHGLRDAAGRPVTGHGVVVCAVETGGVDVLHPLFFRADGGELAWVDVDGDGRFTPGVDEVDVDGVRAVLRWLPLTPTGGTSADPPERVDLRAGWAYADLDGSGAREAGPAHGFTDATPAFGEPLFVAADLDGDGVLTVGEPFVRLATSKIAGIYRVADRSVYDRGFDLITFTDVPWAERRQHGTLTASVVVGGDPRYGDVHGVGPDADLVVIDTAYDDGELSSIHDPEIYGGVVEGYAWARAHGAVVATHAYSYFGLLARDGTGWHAQVIDSLDASWGVLSATGTGNGGLDRTASWAILTPGDRVTAHLDVPADLVGADVLVRWHGAGVAEVVVTVTAPDGGDHGFSRGTHGGEDDQLLRWTSARGVEVGVFAWGLTGQQTTAGQGRWTVTVDAGAAEGVIRWAASLLPTERASPAADASWEPASVEGTMLPPSTADAAIVAAAFDLLDEPGVDGARTFASITSRGPRIDGQRSVDVLTPTRLFAGSPGPLFDAPAPVSIYYGTSAAVAYLGGALALLRQVAPDLDAAAVQALLGGQPDDVVPPALDVHALLSPFTAEPGPTPAEPEPVEPNDADATGSAEPDTAEAVAPDGVGGPSVARDPGGCASGGGGPGGGAPAVAALLALLALGVRRRRVAA